jgi:hypothetical protein
MIEYLPLVLTGVGIIVSILYYSNVLRNANKTQQLQLETRQTQLFMNIYNTASSKQYQKDRSRIIYVWEYEDLDDFFSKYGLESNPDEHAVWDMFVHHYEGIAVLVKRGLIDSALVYDLMYDSIIMFWNKFEPILLEIRKEYGPKTWEDLEFLKDEMVRLKEEE